MMERRDMMQQWLQKALNKIDTMPREELIASLESMVSLKMKILCKN